MLTRLKVNGFKNLIGVDVRFGPFTCIAGANGVGKSNLFDAIRFLSALSEKTLTEAALTVRDEEGRTDIRSLFHRVGDQYDQEMSFEAEMIVPRIGKDDLNQEAQASITFLRYTLDIAYKENGSKQPASPLEIRREELVHITLGDASRHLMFPHSLAWRKSAIQGRRSGGPFLSTEGEGESRIIKLHQDGGGHGRPISRAAKNLPRTVLSTVNAAESPTVLLAKREMQSWVLLQLEPSALRRPDEFTAPARIGSDGAHMAATLQRLARPLSSDTPVDETQVFGQIALRLSDLINL